MTWLGHTHSVTYRRAASKPSRGSGSGGLGGGFAGSMPGAFSLAEGPRRGANAAVVKFGPQFLLSPPPVGSGGLAGFRCSLSIS